MRRHRWTAWCCFGLDRPRAPLHSSEDSRHRLATRVGGVRDLSAAFSRGGEGMRVSTLLDRPVLPQSSNSTSHSISLLRRTASQLVGGSVSICLQVGGSVSICLSSTGDACLDAAASQLGGGIALPCSSSTCDECFAVLTQLCGGSASPCPARRCHRCRLTALRSPN